MIITCKKHTKCADFFWISDLIIYSHNNELKYVPFDSNKMYNFLI